VYAVPKVVINNDTEFVGAQSEAHFLAYVANAAGVEEPALNHSPGSDSGQVG